MEIIRRIIHQKVRDATRVLVTNPEIEAAAEAKRQRKAAKRLQHSTEGTWLEKTKSISPAIALQDADASPNAAHPADDANPKKLPSAPNSET